MAFKAEVRLMIFELAMIQNLFARSNYNWTIFHVILGVVCSFNKWMLIPWFYIIILSSFNLILSNLLIHKSIKVLFHLLFIYARSKCLAECLIYLHLYHGSLVSI